ncbi:MAG TPA: fibronectin type III domain-containing protein, partial [Bacteroidota bacterium]|nr:fibronectin type III domain-containing protein [Bacteroidota bacterium]
MRTNLRLMCNAGVLRTAIIVIPLLLAPASVPLAAQPSLPGQETAMTTDSLVAHDPGFAKIMLIARVHGDSVVLRWAPSTPHGWRVANRTGYVVERRGRQGEFLRLTPDTLHPWLPMRFIDEMRSHEGNPYLGLVLNALWADSALLGLDGADTLRENAARNVNLFGFALFAADNDPYIADAMGLRFVDRAVTLGERYTYRVRLNEEREYRIDPATVDVDVRPAAEGPPPVNLSARGVERRIELRWDPQPDAEYTGYLVSRSDDGGRTFRQLNARPIVIVTGTDTAMRAQGGYTDSAVARYKVYVYRVRGINPFGERGAAADVRAFARDLTPPPAPRVHNPGQGRKAVVLLTWDMPAPSPDLAGFIVSRSALPDSLYHDLTPRLLAKSARRFADTKADPAEPYYIVTSVDTAGNRAPSFPLLGALVDTLPPAIPTGLRGHIDAGGAVHLAWNRNRERDVIGYRVLRANDLRHEFTQLTGSAWRDTAFVDTVETRTLTRFVYYRIAAVNARFNHSRATVPLALRRPDAVPPEPPVFTDVRTGDSSVVLRWV